MPDCCGLVEIDGQIITARNLADAVSAIMQRLDQDHSFLVCTLANLDHLVKLSVNPRVMSDKSRTPKPKWFSPWFPDRRLRAASGVASRTDFEIRPSA